MGYPWYLTQKAWFNKKQIQRSLSFYAALQEFIDTRASYSHSLNFCSGAASNFQICYGTCQLIDKGISETRIAKRLLQNTAILVMIFWNFTVFQCRSNSPQLKQILISSITNLLYELSNELPNGLKLSILGHMEIVKIRHN